MSDTRTPLTRNFVSALGMDGISRTSGNRNGSRHRNIDYIDDKICQLSGIVRGEIITSALDEE